MSLLADVAKGSAAAVEAVENALKLPGTPAEELAELEKSARAQIQKDLEALQRNALAERGFTESDVSEMRMPKRQLWQPQQATMSMSRSAAGVPHDYSRHGTGSSLT